MSSPVATISFFSYKGLSRRAWAFGQMQFAHRPLLRTAGLQFYKMLGSGRGLGFHPLPDWGVYALLGVWESEAAANAFFSDGSVFQKFKEKSEEQWTLYLKPMKIKGTWSGGNPFEPAPDLDTANPMVAVITRATIRPSKLWHFWRYVPSSQRPIEASPPGLLFTKGIGEVPFLQMATFSLWENQEALANFAYQSAEHLTAIRKTRELDWYKEEMFVRFQPYRSVGTWGGQSIIG